MTYQAPAFMVSHPAASLTIADVQTFNTNTFTDDSKRALIDSRQGELGSFNATSSDGGVKLDFGSNIPTVNRCVIPAGHTFAGQTMRLFSDEIAGGDPFEARASKVVTDASLIDFSFATMSDQSLWLFNTFTAVPPETFSFSEFWLGLRKELTPNDGRVSQGFVRAFEHDVSEDEFGGRTTSLELAPARRKFSLKIRDLDPDKTDFATLDEVIRNGRARPFWYWTPDDTDTGPYLVKLIRSATRVQTSDIPKTFMRYEVQLEMLEQLT